MNPVIGGIVSTVANAADRLFTSDEERLRAELDARRIDQAVDIAQIEVTKTSANHASVFVAGARPFAIWLCACGIGYQAVVRDLLIWLLAIFSPDTIPPPPSIDVEGMYVLLGGLLGLGGMREYGKRFGRARDNLQQISHRKR